MYSTLRILSIVSSVDLSCAVGTFAASQPVEKIATKLAGVWNEGIRADLTCDNKTYHHAFSLSADGLVLTKRYLVPYEGNYGRVSEERYRVLYGDDNSLMLFREGESFENRETGDKVIRQLIVESEKIYTWRVYGTPREQRAAAGGLRCMS